MASICLVKILILLLVFFSTDVMVPSVFGAKILLIPANMNSHVLYFSRLAADLTHLGHVTRVLAPSNARVPNFVAEFESGGNFTYTKYPVDGDAPFLNSRHVSEVLTRLAVSQSVWEQLSDTRNLMKELTYNIESDCVRLLDNARLMQQIRDGGFQFAVMDGIIPHCYLAIPYSMGARYAILSLPSAAWLYRVPRLPSFSSSVVLGYTDQMTLLQRVATFVFQMVMLYQFRNDTTAYVTRLAPGRPPITAYQLAQQVYKTSRPYKFLCSVLYICLIRKTVQTVQQKK